MLPTMGRVLEALEEGQGSSKSFFILRKLPDTSGGGKCCILSDLA